MIVQISLLPGDTIHVAELRGPFVTAVEQLADNLTSHKALGGYVGIAPCDEGTVVQLHAPDGSIEAWRIVASYRPVTCEKCGGQLQSRGCGTCYGRELEQDRGVTNRGWRGARLAWIHKEFVPRVTPTKARGSFAAPLDSHERMVP